MSELLLPGRRWRCRWRSTSFSRPSDGDSVSITAATLPSIEDVVMGAIPGLPKVHLHNPVLAYESRATIS